MNILPRNFVCKFPTFLLFVFVVACTSAKHTEGAYSRGVHAYRAKQFTAAREAWTSAVAEGDHTAENNLGYLFYEGLGGEAAPERAVALWRSAAMAGESESQWHLGQAYLDGKGVSRDSAQAYAWFKCASATAELPGARFPDIEQDIANDARRSLEKLLDSLSKDDFERGAALAQSCIRDYAKRTK